MRTLISLLVISLMSGAAWAQERQPATTVNSAPQISVAGTTMPFGLEDGTPVRLRFAKTVSSADTKTGDTIDFEVLEDVKIGDIVVVPKDGVAWATVTRARNKRRMGRGGKLDINIDSVRLANGQKIALRAIKETSGAGHVGRMTGAIAATSLVFPPAAPFFLLMHGKDISIPSGTEITAYVNGDIPLDKGQFRTKQVTPETAADPQKKTD